jgi:hypothetical protein
MNSRTYTDNLDPEALFGIDGDSFEQAFASVDALLSIGTGNNERNGRELNRVLAEGGDTIRRLCSSGGFAPESVAAGLVSLRKAWRLDAGDMARDAKDEARANLEYERRLLFELLQNLHDAVAATGGHPPIGQFGLGVKSVAGCPVPRSQPRHGLPRPTISSLHPSQASWDQPWDNSVAHAATQIVRSDKDGAPVDLMSDHPRPVGAPCCGCADQETQGLAVRRRTHRSPLVLPRQHAGAGKSHWPRTWAPDADQLLRPRQSTTTNGCGNSPA